MLTKQQAAALRAANVARPYRVGKGAGPFNRMVRRLIADLLLEETVMDNRRAVYRRTGLGEDALDLYDAAKPTAIAADREGDRDA